MRSTDELEELFFPRALLPGGWASSVRLTVSAGGALRKVAADADAEGATRIDGVAVPGVPNVHSHAFQRALVGLTERSGPGGDTFWTWRRRMYAFLERLDPGQVEAVAAQLQAEMLRHGFTSVAEFHYLRNAPGGAPYDDPVEMGRRIQAAADRTGIGLTMLPVLYRTGGFGGEPPNAHQRRFVVDPERLIEDVEALRAAPGDASPRRAGLALHSLRAVPSADLRRALEGLDALEAGAGTESGPGGRAGGRAPIHIHVAEQTAEVEACLAATGARPVRWLLDHAPVDGRWCLIHATHVDDDEVRRMAASGAVVGLCPTTEANLGDGIFPLVEYVERGGRWAVGTDSHVSVSPAAELRMLEYGQRLTRRRRNVAAGAAGAAMAGPAMAGPAGAGGAGVSMAGSAAAGTAAPAGAAMPGGDTGRSTGRALLDSAWRHGARACGQDVGRLEEGARADLVVLDPEHPALVGRSDDALLDAWVFGGEDTPVRDVMAGGRWRVRDGRHLDGERISEAYRRVARELAGS